MNASTISSAFAPGQAVIVRHEDVSLVNGQVTGRVMQPAFTGTVVAYWRNGFFTVRESQFGTTCAYPARELSAA